MSIPETQTDNWTCDALFNGRLAIRQARKGYRFSVDAVLLAGLTEAKAKDHIADLGTGCGVVPLIMAHRGMGRKFLGLELQDELARLAQWNVRENGYADRIEIIQMDLRDIGSTLSPRGYDLVVSNPPYRKTGSGRICPDVQRAVARHELSLSLKDVFRAASHLLRGKGRLALIYPATRLEHLMAVARQCRFSPKRLTMIHSRKSSPAVLVHMECLKEGGQELKVEPPLAIYRADGSFTRQMQRLYEAWK